MLLVRKLRAKPQGNAKYIFTIKHVKMYISMSGAGTESYTAAPMGDVMRSGIRNFIMKNCFWYKCSIQKYYTRTFFYTAALYVAVAHAERGRDAGLCRADERCDRSAGIRHRNIAAAHAAGMNGHLAKPIDMDEVVKVICRVLTGSDPMKKNLQNS